MAGQDDKITQLPELTSASADDLIVIVNDPSGTPLTQKITVDDLFNYIGSLGTSNTIAKFSASGLSDSSITDDGTTVNVGGNLSVDNNLTVGTINSGTSSDFVKGDGSLDSTTYQDTSEKGQANGYTPLDSGAKVAEAYLPDSILGQVSYQGTWAASTNTPTLANPPASTTKGEYYVASDDGTQFGIDFKTGDWIISNGSAWEKVDNTDAVTSVFGRLGNVVANAADYASFYVDLNTNQTINGLKKFNDSIIIQDADPSRFNFLGFKQATSGSSGLNGHTAISPSGSNSLGISYNQAPAQNKIINLSTNLVDADNFTRNFEFPNASGTFALTSDLNTLNASNITTGTLADARLSSNVALKNIDNNFSVGQTIGGVLQVNVSSSSAINHAVFENSQLGSSFSAGSFITMGRPDINRSIDIGIYGNGSNEFDGKIVVNETGGSLILGTNGTERMRIASSGNVGIGTSPTTKLQLKMANDSILSFTGIGSLSSGIRCSGSIGFESDFNFVFRDEDGSNERMRIDSSGNVTISGSLSKGSGSFKIDHPLPEKKDTHHLVHSFVEAPQADNIYRGKIDLVDGKATINLDEAGRMTEGTFVLLNGNIQCFTSNESGWTAIRGTVEGNTLTIEAQDAQCTDTISWLVIGERIDQHMIDTEWTDENGRVITEPLKEVEPTPSEEITE